MRPVDKDLIPTNDRNEQILFTEYTNSRRYLIDIIGEYCSYCERHIPTSLAVEHVRPKTHNPTLELVWSNLLLACTNCNSTKGHKNVILAEYFWPHTDDTFKVFEYDLTGIVKPNPTLTDAESEMARKLIELAGLDKTESRPNTTEWENASDRRFEHRLQAYIDAFDYANKYRNSSAESRSQNLELYIAISTKGFWSIWMKAFRDFPEVLTALVNSIPGTRMVYFP